MTINPDGRRQSLGALSGSREPDPSCTGSGPTGFDPERLRELADICEASTGPDRHLDALISQACFPLNSLVYRYLLAKVTREVEDARLLIPADAELAIYTHWALTRGFPQNKDGSWTITDQMPRGVWVRTYGGDQAHKNCEGLAHTLPLALSAIGLRMIAATAELAAT